MRRQSLERGSRRRASRAARHPARQPSELVLFPLAVRQAAARRVKPGEACLSPALTPDRIPIGTIQQDPVVFLYSSHRRLTAASWEGIKINDLNSWHGICFIVSEARSPDETRIGVHIMKISKLFAATAVAMTLAGGAAIAAPIVGFSAIDFGTVAGVQGAGNVLSMTGNAYDTPQGGAFVGTAGVVVADFSVTQTNFTPLSFTSANGSFAGTVLSVGFSGQFTNIVAEGVFTPAGALAGDDPNDMQFNLTYTFISGSVSGGGVINSQFIPVRIPEPMTLALFGLGLAGLGVAARRKA